MSDATNLLKWDAEGSRLYETGIDRVVLYPWDNNKGSDGKGDYGSGVAWNGVSSVSESPSGGEATDIYADNTKYLSLMSKETFSETIEAYMYPDEWAACDGSESPVPGVKIYQQTRKAFGLCYRTLVGNDTEGEDYGYKLHLVYGCKASPSERSYSTTNDSPEASTMSYSVNTTPIEVNGYKPTSLITINSRDFKTENLKKRLEALEAVLYGVKGETPETDVPATLPKPDEVFRILSTDVQGVG